MKRRCSRIATTASTLFPVLWCDCPRVILSLQTLGKLFLSFLNQRLRGSQRILPLEKSNDLEANDNSALAFPARSPRESRWPFPLRTIGRRANGAVSSARFFLAAHWRPFVRPRRAPPSMRRDLSFRCAERFKRAVFRWPVSH